MSTTITLTITVVAAAADSGGESPSVASGAPPHVGGEGHAGARGARVGRDVRGGRTPVLEHTYLALSIAGRHRGKQYFRRMYSSWCCAFSSEVVHRGGVTAPLQVLGGAVVSKWGPRKVRGTCSRRDD